ncbi:DUF2877 domain-containing protein [Paenibacillus sp. DMB20]|uniref:DUF2877 domain-containing protein n=1 Tax=Paenibacillus sp. DMB20 TaxID=1642570 RepID=UPI0006999DD9|nr:DUF2877 domain-containing protein [Paenibacillus sp. DMB20]
MPDKTSAAAEPDPIDEGGNQTKYSELMCSKDNPYASFAISGDEVFIKRLRERGFRGTIHSIFDRTVNIKCDFTRDLYTVASRKTDNAPHTIVADIDSCAGRGLAIGDPVILTDGQLLLGPKLAVSVEQAAVWRCALPAYPTADEPLRSNLAEAVKEIGSRGRGGGTIRSADAGSIEIETARLLNERTADLLRELSQVRMEKAFSYAIRLIGLGPGLTPSGDDFLTGLFAAMNLPKSPLYSRRFWCRDVEAAAASMTNEISCMAMKKAAIGQVRESIVDLAHSLIHGSRDGMLSSLSAVLDIGSSSGSDIALGLAKGLELNLKLSRR